MNKYYLEKKIETLTEECDILKRGLTELREFVTSPENQVEFEGNFVSAGQVLNRINAIMADVYSIAHS